MKSLTYLNKYLLRYRLKILIGFLFILMANIFALFPAQLIGKSLNLIIESISYQSGDFNESSGFLKSYCNDLTCMLLIFSVLLIVSALLRGVFMFFMRQNIIVVSRYIEYDLKNEIYSKYQKLSSTFYNKNDSGDLLNRITDDVSKVRMYLGPAIMYGLNLVTLIVLIFSRMLSVSPVLTIIVLLPLPILSFLIYRVSSQINFKSNLVQEKLSSLTNIVQETISGIRLVKSFVRERHIVNRFNLFSTDYMDHQITLSRVNSIFFPLVLFLVGLSVLLTIYFGGLFVMTIDVNTGVPLLTVGEVAEFIIYVNMLTWPFTSIGWVTEVIQRASVSQYRINEFLQSEEISNFHKEREGLQTFAHLQDSMRFSNVSYQYPGAEKPALKILNAVMEANKIHAVVGGVGSGKTTFLKLLSGILSPDTGDLYFDQLPSSKLNWYRCRKHISYVSQNVFLFSDTIRNNIVFSNDDISNQQVVTLLKNLSLFKEISSFQDGLNTKIGEGGITLSGGQKQRIALARAIITQPKILILDDVFSNIDSSTELKIMNYIISKLPKTTIVLSSNRLSVLKFSANIFVLNFGKVIEVGSHAELIKNNGEYYNLFFNQLR